MFYGQALKKIRKEKKITSLELAKYLNKTRETVSSWERGIYQPCNSDIRVMAQFFNVPVHAISDLLEVKIENNRTEEQDYSDLDIKNLPPDIALKLKTMHNSCLDLRAINTKQSFDLFRYRILIQNLPILIYVKDKNLKYTYANELFLNLIGRNYSTDNLLGTSSYDIFGLKEYSAIMEFEQKVLQTKQRISNQQIYIPGTFKRKIGLLTIIPILSDNKSLERIVCSIEDVTDYHAEEDRRKDLEKVINKIHHMIWIGETVNNNENSFRYTFISDTILEIYGITKHEAFKDNQAWLKIVHNSDIEIVNNWKETKDFPKKIKYKINNPEKGVRWISSEVFKEGENKFYGVVSDITEEIEKEIEKDVILDTLDATTDAINMAKIKDNIKEYIYFNQANKNLYEQPLAKIKKNPEIWKDFIHPGDKNKISISESEKPEGHSCLFYRLLFPDGRIKYIKENTFRENIDGVLYSGTINRDVTEESKINGHNNKH